MTILIKALKTFDKIKQPSANFKKINTLSKVGIETSLNIKKGTWKYHQMLYDYTVEVKNRFKGLDLIDRVPEELWTEIHDIVQEAGTKTIPKKKKCRRAKWLSDETLKIAMKRREAKGKGEKQKCRVPKNIKER